MPPIQEENKFFPHLPDLYIVHILQDNRCLESLGYSLKLFSCHSFCSALYKSVLCFFTVIALMNMLPTISTITIKFLPNLFLFRLSFRPLAVSFSFLDDRLHNILISSFIIKGKTFHQRFLLLWGYLTPIGGWWI